MSTRNLVRKILGPYRISHHPFCDHFKDHIYIIGKTKVCRGCVMQYSGILFSLFIIGLGGSFGWWNSITEIQVGAFLYTLILPTILSAFFIENRRIKDFSRFLLGAAFSLAFILLFFTPNWLIKGWILLNLIPSYILLNQKRARNNNQICHHCDSYDKIPYCPGYQIYSDREQIFSAQAVHGGIHDPFSLPPDQLEE